MSAIPNEWQSNAWDGDEGAHWAAHADRYDEGMARYDDRVLAAAAIGENEAVLDIGCGCGQTSLAAARIARSGSVLGVDLSHAMLAVATERARAPVSRTRASNAADAQVHPIHARQLRRRDQPLWRDVLRRPGRRVFQHRSRDATRRPRRVRRVAGTVARTNGLRALRDALAAGRDLPSPPPNAPGPFGLADPEHVRAVFGAAGFVDVQLEDAREPWHAGADADDAFGFVSQVGMVRGIARRPRRRRA